MFISVIFIYDIGVLFNVQTLVYFQFVVICFSSNYFGNCICFPRVLLEHVYLSCCIYVHTIFFSKYYKYIVIVTRNSMDVLLGDVLFLVFKKLSVFMSL